MILLDHRVTKSLDQAAADREIPGSAEAQRYPFLIDEQGISIMPVTSLALDYTVPTERVSTGVSRLDHMLRRGGVFRGTTVLVSGASGTGKTTVAAQMAAAACARRVARVSASRPDRAVRPCRPGRGPSRADRGPGPGTGRRGDRSAALRGGADRSVRARGPAAARRPHAPARQCGQRSNSSSLPVPCRWPSRATLSGRSSTVVFTVAVGTFEAPVDFLGGVEQVRDRRIRDGAAHRHQADAGG